jgi:hypothetical protein
MNIHVGSFSYAAMLFRSLFNEPSEDSRFFSHNRPSGLASICLTACFRITFNLIILLILAVMKVVVKQKIVGDNETSQFLS